MGALTASVLTAPLIGMCGAGLTFIQNYDDVQSRSLHMPVGTLLVSVGSIFFIFGLLAMLIVGVPSLWAMASLLPHRPVFRSLLLSAEGAVIGGLYLGIDGREEIAIGSLLGGISALIACFLFSLFTKELARG